MGRKEKKTAEKRKRVLFLVRVSVVMATSSVDLVSILAVAAVTSCTIIHQKSIHPSPTNRPKNILYFFAIDRRAKERTLFNTEFFNSQLALDCISIESYCTTSHPCPQPALPF